MFNSRYVRVLSRRNRGRARQREKGGTETRSAAGKTETPARRAGPTKHEIYRSWPRMSEFGGTRKRGDASSPEREGQRGRDGQTDRETEREREAKA